LSAIGLIPVAPARKVAPAHPAHLAHFRSQFERLAARGTELAAADLVQALDGILHAFKTAVPASEGGIESDASEPLRAVRHFIESNLHRPELSVAEIAHAAHVSRSGLYRLFAEQELSVHGELRERRLQRGLRYLSRAEHGRMSIGAIAFACGFSDQAVFSKQFRQRFGIAPREARHGAPAA